MTLMRVFSQINNCQQKKQNKKQTKQKGGPPLLSLAKSMYYILQGSPQCIPQQ